MYIKSSSFDCSCLCYRFGKNMKRTGLGSCYIQAFVYFLLAICEMIPPPIESIKLTENYTL
ncbi:hypothetical protein MtrunA17_Chr8g0356161 [Medicago truncatula]|uniref:Transmembrane protein, putative n=1 Tax=Medicago truncatula TaxID=3880 RepID=A0A072TPH9_MEDTR|nr:transmembrane protein, putative [Medicago truncatula]RHN40573.1 hypothetical protein MtrunA17_Chr8g0356161 [Medicago truncatula]